jgi:transposase
MFVQALLAQSPVEALHHGVVSGFSGSTEVQFDPVFVGPLVHDLTVTGHTVELAWADQGYRAEQPRRDAQAHGIELQVIKLAEARKGFVLLPKRWVVERSFAWVARFRRLVEDHERLPDVLRGLHFLVFAILMLPKAIALLTGTGNA